MAIEVLGLPESFDSHATAAMVEVQPRDAVSYGPDDSVNAFFDTSVESTLIISGSIVAVAALALWASQWFWPRKDR